MDVCRVRESAWGLILLCTARDQSGIYGSCQVPRTHFLLGSVLESGGRRKAGELDGVSNKHRQMPGKVRTRVIGLAKEERKIRKGERGKRRDRGML